MHIAGRTTESQASLLGELAGSSCVVKQHGYLSHHQSLLLAASADILMLTLADTPGAERVVPAKIFEYMALQKSILAIVPPGETRDILTGYSQASVFHPSDKVGIAQHLLYRCNQQTVGDSPIADANFVHQFSRSTQAEQLADILDRLESRSS